MQLQQRITPTKLMLTAIGGIIGSGWLFGPFYAAKIAGPAAIIAWLLGGLLMMVIAFTFAELASMLPEAGGMARFAHYSHGTFVSFTMAWISWLAALTVAPIETMAAIQYAANYIPGLVMKTGNVTVLTHMGMGVAAIVMLFMCSLNMLSVKFFAKTNSYIVIWKLIIPAITIIMLFTLSFHINNFVSHSFAPYGLKGVLQALPAAGVIFSFIGYSPAIQLAGEAKRPQFAIPLAIIGAITFAIILYVVLQFAFIAALKPDLLTHGWKHLDFAGEAGPIAGILTGLGVVWFVKVLYLDAMVSPFGTAFTYTAATARINMAMTENGYMPAWMKFLNRNGVPYLAILINFIVGLIFLLPFPGWQAMVGFLVSCFVLAYAVGPIACVTLRQTMPDKKRPFKIPFVYPFCMLAFYICNLIVYWTAWHTVWRMLLTIGIGYLILIFMQVNKAEKLKLTINQGYWLLPYFIGIGLISYLGAFGGLKIIPFGWDFLVIAIFSIIIFIFATRNKTPEIASNNDQAFKQQIPTPN